MAGHFEATGLLGVEGPGFKMFVADAVEVVAGDPDATAAQQDAARRELDEHEALSYMRGVLSEFDELA